MTGGPVAVFSLVLEDESGWDTGACKSGQSAGIFNSRVKWPGRFYE